MPSRQFFIQQSILNWVAKEWPSTTKEMGPDWVLSRIIMRDYFFDEIREEFNRLVSQ